jgi:hypothetical protein
MIAVEQPPMSLGQFLTATVFSRDGTDWVGHLVTGDATLALPPLGVELPLSAVDDGIEIVGQDVA